MQHFIDNNLVLQDLYRWSHDMPAVIVSPKFQVVIPKEVRDQLGIVAGQRLQVFVFEGHIELLPIEPLENLRGILKGVDVPFEREPDRL